VDRAELQKDHDQIFTIIEQIKFQKLDTHEQRLQIARMVLDYFSDHLNREERAMRDFNYDRLIEHEIEHERLHDCILKDGMLGKIMHGTPEEVYTNLKDVLLRHVVTWDLDFEAWIERRQFDRLTRRVNVWQRPSPSL
jgi:hemerythrin-like metal-binding protein